MRTEIDEAPVSWARALQGLADRIVGRAPAITWVSLDGAPPRSAKVGAQHGRLTVEATDGISAAVALHHYLREVCGRAVHWDTPVPLGLTTFPDSDPLEITARVREQYYLNFCTFDYTMPFWQWDRWEAEIDWMALHGVTMPLALVGHEAVVFDALRELGVQEERILEYLGSPAYTAWTFMGCLESEIPSVDTLWLEERAALGARIIAREREFGMTPVLPAFTGQIPRELAPDSVERQDWQGHETWVLSPDDALFATVGAMITRHQSARFGTDHLYASDPFIEMLPFDDDLDFAGRVATAILSGLTAVDPQAKWVLQAWPFAHMPEYWNQDRVRAFIRGVDQRNIIILDLWAEIAPQWSRFDAFSGAEWHWCSLLNFGGRSDPMADLSGAIAAFEAAYRSERPPVGLGLAMEATRNNHLFFELMTDLAWREIPDLTRWVRDFAAQRHGVTPDSDLIEAWTAVTETVYANSGLRLHPDDFRGVLGRRPSAWRPQTRNALADDVRGLIQYEPTRLVGAWEAFTRAAEVEPTVLTHVWGRDLLDSAIAVLLRVVDILCLRVIDSVGADEESGATLMDLLRDLDLMLACHPEYRLESWERAADEAGHSAAQSEHFVRASRQLLTRWSTPSVSILEDYAGRMWQGLVGDFYRGRWAAWLEHAKHGFPDDDVARLEQELDRLAHAVVETGATVQELPLGELPARSRNALHRYAPILLYGVDHLRGDASAGEDR